MEEYTATKKLIDSYNLSSRRDDSFYTMIIEPDPLDESKASSYVPLDLVTGITESMSSDITSYPLLTGDIIMDHKYDHPEKLTISGEFSCNGKFAMRRTFAGSNPVERMKNVQEYFKYVRKRGLRIKLVFGFSNQNVFSEINDLVLNDISFNMRYNSMSFTFSLTQVYFFESEEDIAPVEISDPDVPTYTEFKALDFSQDVLGGGDNGQLEDIVLNQLNNLGCMQVSFMEVMIGAKNFLLVKAFQKYGGEAVTTAIGAVVQTVGKAVWKLTPKLIKAIINAVVKAVIKLIAKITGKTVAEVTKKAAVAASNAIPVVGQVITVVSVAVDIGIIIYKAIKYHRNRKLYVTFKNFDDDDKQSAEYDKFARMMVNVREYYDSVVTQQGLEFYGFTTNIQKQEMYKTIGGTMYHFQVEKETPTSLWSMRIFEIDSGEESEVSAKNCSVMRGNKSFLDLTNKDAIFTTDSGYSCYLLNQAYQLEDLDDDSLRNMLNDAWKAGSCGFLGYTDDEMKDRDNPPTDDLVSRFKQDGIYKDLTKFNLVIIPPNVSFKDIKKAFEKDLKNCFLSESYK